MLQHDGTSITKEAIDNVTTQAAMLNNPLVNMMEFIIMLLSLTAG